MIQPDVSAAVSTPAYTPHSDRRGAVAEPREWTLAQRFGFRCLFIYALVYTYPGPLDELPGVDFLRESSDAMWRVVVPWVGAHVLHLANPVSIRPSGSGDKQFDWVQVFTMLCLAVIGATIWTLLDRRHRSHRSLFAAIRLYVRFTLASILFGYGFDKVVPNQFEPMNPVRLTEYFGEASPGGFAWAFLGFSLLYEVFAGAGEVLAGVLLLFRRTATLGALIGAGVLTNVFMLNMSFDIPVKQFSFHLLLMCVFLLACDATRLLNVFIRHRTAEAPVEIELFAAPKVKRIALGAGWALGLWMIVGHFRNEYNAYAEFGHGKPHGALYGVFEVEQVVKNGVVQPPLMTDSTRWRRLSVGPYRASVRLATDSLVPYGVTADSLKHTATFASGPAAPKIVLSYAFPDTTHLLLRGHIGPDSIEMTFRRRRDDSYLLMNRGFHWVNEVPFFR